MPTKRFPRPANWQDFEIFMKNFFNKKYDGGFDRYGREGQAQYGIDIIGTYNGKNIGIQCKRIEEGLTIGLVEKEATETNKCPIKLDSYVFVTTDKRDKKIQNELAALNQEREKNELCNIEIMFWETIEEELNLNLELQKVHYNDIHSKIDHNYHYEHIIRSIKKAFTRSAFFTPFSCEGNVDDLMTALKKTQEFLATGKLRSNDGQYILETASFRELKFKEDIIDGENIFILLQDTRDTIQKGLSERAIRCNNNWYDADFEITQKINNNRKKIIELLNKIFDRYGEDGVHLPY